MVRSYGITVIYAMFSQSYNDGGLKHWQLFLAAKLDTGAFKSYLDASSKKNWQESEM